MFLVDGSYSYLTNFAQVRAFLEFLVHVFVIGSDKVQIGLVQYGQNPHTEFDLNTHRDLHSVVRALRTFPHLGGITNTGQALTFVREKIFQTNRGARANMPRVLVLVTNGKSSDMFREAAMKLRSADVEIFVVGVKNADRRELKAIANPPAETHVYVVNEFNDLHNITEDLSRSICNWVEPKQCKWRKQFFYHVSDLNCCIGNFSIPLFLK